MIKRVLPLVVILVLGGISYLVINNPPQAQRVPPQRDPAISVGVEVVQPRPYRIWIDSYGRVRPRTQSDLLPQVDGEVVWIAPDFRAGGFFEAGDELLRIDDRDYRAALAQAQANLMAARQVLSEEQARSEQARADWRRLGNGGEPPALVVRVPQLNAARGLPGFRRGGAGSGAAGSGTDPYPRPLCWTGAGKNGGSGPGGVQRHRSGNPLCGGLRGGAPADPESGSDLHRTAGTLSLQ